MRYVIYGIPGVGKTSVVQKIIEKTGIKHLHWGDMSVEIAMEKGFIEDRDELRQLGIEQQIEVKREVGDRIKQIADESDKEVLIETHAAVKTPAGYMPGLSIKTIEKIQPKVFIVLQAKPEYIYQRRLLDDTRWRKDDLTIDDVKESLNVTRQMAMVNAVLAAGTVVFVENKEGEVDYAVDRIVDLIEHGRLHKHNLGAI